eukprot:CFRG8594T1
MRSPSPSKSPTTSVWKTPPDVEATLVLVPTANHRRSFLPLVPYTVTSKIDRVCWIDTMRIIACLAVPIVHAINCTGIPGMLDPKFPDYNFLQNAAKTMIHYGRFNDPSNQSEVSHDIENYIVR